MTHNPRQKKEKEKGKLHTLRIIFKGVTVQKHLARKSTKAKRVEEIHFLALKMQKSLVFFVLFGEFAKAAIEREYLDCHHENQQCTW